MASFPTATLKKEIDLHEGRIQSLEKTTALNEVRSKENKEEIEKLDEKYDKLENVVIESGATLKLVRWVLALLGASIIGLIWSLITGQASVIFH